MKLKYVGDLDEVTVRGVTFPKGQAVDVSDNALLAEKMANWPDVEEVKRGRKPKADEDEA